MKLSDALTFLAIFFIFIMAISDPPVWEYLVGLISN